MARAGEVYGGAWGRTRTEAFHESCACGFIYAADLHRAVNVTRDPALGTRLVDGTLGAVTCPSCGAAGRIDLPVIYHDEQRRRFILVLPSALRHRELEERAELLLLLARDRGHFVPTYVRDFAVVFGGDELKRYLDAENAAGRRVEERSAELERLAAKLARRQAELDELAAAIEQKGREMEIRAGAPHPAEEEPKPIFGDVSGGIHTVVEDSTGKFAYDSSMPEKPRPGLARDAAVLRWRDARSPSGYVVEQGDVRLLFRVAARPQAAALQVRLQLHRLPTYPVLVVAVILGEGGEEPLTVTFDVAAAEDRQALGILAASFHLVVDFFDESYEPLSRREVILPLAANVRYSLALADEYLGQVPAARRSFETALTAWRAPGFDRHGRKDHRLEEDSFALLPSASAAQKALASVASWSEPDNEDYLLLIRSFPLEWWRKIRGRVITRAVNLGLALPGVLVEVALSDGLYRNRKDVSTRTMAAFTLLLEARDKSMDLDPEGVAGNWRTILAMCEEDGVVVDSRVLELARAGGGFAASRVVVGTPRDAGASPVVVRPAVARAREETGRIAVPLDVVSQVTRAPVPRRDVRTAPGSELLEMLDDKDARLGAALELCRRVDALAVGPVFGALRRMARGEAVRILPAVVKFGERAVPHLVDGLRSRKAYLRQGSALALGVLKSADGIDPLCELLLNEPTDVWKEVARALGEIGGGAVMSLAGRLRDPDVPLSEAEARERITWALAHCCAKGARAAVEAQASGRDASVAGVARRALELANNARDNDSEVRGPVAPHDQTVNRAFSRRFFEAMGVLPLTPEDKDSGHISIDEELDSAEILVDDEILEEEDIVHS